MKHNSVERIIRWALVPAVVVLAAFVVQIPQAKAATVSYNIKAYTNSNTLVVSYSGQYYQIVFSSGCSFPNSIVGLVYGTVNISIDSNTGGPFVGASVTYSDGILTQNCSVTSTRSFAITQFTLVNALGANSTHLVISYNNQNYQIDISSSGTGFASGVCPRSSFDVGQTISVDTNNGIPAPGNIEFPNVGYAMSCRIDSVKKLNLSAYVIEKKLVSYPETNFILSQGDINYSVTFSPSVSIDCNILDSDVGKTIMVDSSGLPSVGAIAYIPQPSGASNCTVVTSSIYVPPTVPVVTPPTPVVAPSTNTSTTNTGTKNTNATKSTNTNKRIVNSSAPTGNVNLNTNSSRTPNITNNTNANTNALVNSSTNENVSIGQPDSTTTFSNQTVAQEEKVNAKNNGVAWYLLGSGGVLGIGFWILRRLLWK